LVWSATDVAQIVAVPGNIPLINPGDWVVGGLVLPTVADDGADDDQVTAVETPESAMTVAIA